MKSDYKVYVHTNKTNGKRYYGVTCQDIERRWKHGAGYKGSTSFYDAIKDLGWDAFEHNVVQDNMTKSQAYNLEAELIKKYKTNNRKHGYNLESGGEHPIHADSTNKILSKLLTNRKFSNETLEKMRRSRDSMKKMVRCVETNEEFESITSAAQFCSVHKATMSNTIRKNKILNGYHWIFC